MSQFLNDSDNLLPENHGEIDFDSALRLPEGGTTCDIYRTRWQRREVFVKRLKEEFRSKPLYLDALDKEFDVGVYLHHPSLPEYREFHRDYIVMDYVDGLTLAEMIRRHDPWLSDRRNVVKMLRQLVDVVDYLHRHNVVHCDIKPDNIIITAHSKNLVLIDFDKSYTDALRDTSGHPARYGLPTEQLGHPALDFHGIARVAERLNVRGLGKFIKACYRPDTDCEKLTRILSEAEKSKAYYLKIIVALIVIAGVVTAIGLALPKGHTDENPELPSQPPAPEVPVVTAPSQSPAAEAPVVTESVVSPAPVPMAPPQKIVMDETPEQAAKVIVASLEMSLAPYFDDLIERLDGLDRMRNDSTLTAPYLKKQWDSYNAFEKVAIDNVLGSAIKLCPDVDCPKIGDYISDTESYRKYIKRAKVVKNEFFAEIKRRREVE
ncbi:MAG: protein kinase [Muribaculaceae bacterium]|nr:protein kinase [Muribaculaceae bacterium]